MSSSFRMFLMVLVALGWTAPAWAGERLAVLELTGKSLTAEERATLTDTVRGAVVEALGGKIAVMTRENMEVMLTDMGMDATCVSQGACEVETARNLGVDYVISGSIASMSGVQVVSLKLLETRTGQMLASKQVEGAHALELMRALAGPARGLVAPLGGAGPAKTAAPAPAALTEAQRAQLEQEIAAKTSQIAASPLGPGAPALEAQVAADWRKLGKVPEFQLALEALLATCKPGSPWRARNAGDPAAPAAANDLLERTLREEATSWHMAAKRLGTTDEAKAAYAAAWKVYGTYLSQFPDAAHSTDMHYAFGELLYKVKQYSDAYDQYMVVVKANPSGEHAQFCAESAIFAADELVKAEASVTASVKPGSRPAPVAFSTSDQKLMDALKQYAALYPTAPKTRNVIYKAGYLAYNHYQFTLAAESFRAAIAMDPGARESEQAANLILDSLNLMGDWGGLRDNAKAFYDQPGLGSPEFKVEVRQIYDQALKKAGGAP